MFDYIYIHIRDIVRVCIVNSTICTAHVHSLNIEDIVTSPRFIIMLLCDTIHTYMHVMLQQVYTVNMTLSELLLL